MKLSGLRSRPEQALPGITGTARLEKRSGDLIRRLRSGDIAVIDQTDLDRRTAEALVSAGAVAVVNAARSISGRYPNLGPEVLVEAGIVLIDAVGVETLRRIKDGARIRVHEGSVFAGEDEIGSGTQQTVNTVADLMIEAKAGMSTQLEAFSANTIEFLRRERMLVLDGVGVPRTTVSMRGRHALVVAPGYGHSDDLKQLKKFVREYKPVIIGVDTGARTLHEAGLAPHVIVAVPDELDTTTLKCGAEVVVPAQVDGHAQGLELVQDLGLNAVTFPASANTEDLALLLAEANGAELVITVGFQATLQEFLDSGRSGSNPSTFLTRLRLGSKVVDGSAVARLQRSRVSNSAIALLVVCALLVMFVALAVSGVGDVFLRGLGDMVGTVLGYVKGMTP